LDVFETYARILSLATSGASHTRIMALHQYVRQDVIRRILKMLIDNNLLEMDSFSIYWRTVNSVKFLEIQFQFKWILLAQKSLG